MLNNFRAHAKGWLGMLILIIVSVPFALWGIQNYTTGGTEKPLATVGSKKILQDDLNRSYQERVNQIQAQYGENFSPDLIDEPRLRQEVLAQLVQQELLSQIVHTDGYQISDEQVLKVIAEIPAFQTDGKFDKELYQQALRARGQSSNGFIALVKESLRREQLVKGISDTVLVDQSEVRDLYRIFAQSRQIDYLTLSLAKQAEQEQPQQADLLAYYDANKPLYQTPETISISYLELKVDDLAQKISLDDKELRAFYESEIQRFTTAGKRRVSHILFEVPKDASDDTRQAKRSLAEHTLSRLDKGEEFSLLAKELSEDTGSAKEGGDLGIITQGMMPGVFEDTVFALNQSQISDVIETEFGYHIVKLTELSDEQIRPYDEVKQDVAKTYRRQLADEEFYQMAERLRELSYQNPSVLDPAASELALTLQSTPSFDRMGGEGLAEDERIREAAFSSDVLAGNNSDVIELDNGHVVVLRVKDHQPSRTQDLADVRAAVELAVRQQMATDALKVKASELIEQIKKGSNMAELADQNDADYSSPPAFRRNAQDISPELINEAFTMLRPVDEQPVLKSVTRRNGDISVVALKQVKMGDPATMSSKDRDALTQFLKQSRAQSSMAAVMAQMSKRYDVSFKKAEGQQAQ